MSKTYKHQATFDYLHGRKDKVKGNLLKGLRRYFMRCLYSKYDGSRISWFKHKNRDDYGRKEGGAEMNIDMENIKVGDTLMCRGKTYRCVEDNMSAATFDCVDTCALHGNVLCEFCSCLPCDRKDGKSVHFEEVKQ